MTLRETARIAWEKRERQLDADRLEHEQQMCSEALRDFNRAFKDERGNVVYAESAVYNRLHRRVELGFDGGTVKVARCNPGVPSERVWRVLHECPDCGALVAGQIVECLADIGQANDEGPDNLDDHYCPRHENRPLSDYLADAVKEQEWKL